MEMEIERVERVLGVIYPDSIPRSEYSKVIEILAEIGQMIQNTPEPVFIPVSGTPRQVPAYTEEPKVTPKKRGGGRQPLSTDQIQTARQMRQEGKIISEIAAHLHCSPSGIAKYLAMDNTGERTDERTERICLKCDNPFTSKGKDNRICSRCTNINKTNGEAEGIME